MDEPNRYGEENNESQINPKKDESFDFEPNKALPTPRNKKVKKASAITKVAIVVGATGVSIAGITGIATTSSSSSSSSSISSSSVSIVSSSDSSSSSIISTSSISSITSSSSSSSTFVFEVLYEDAPTVLSSQIYTFNKNPASCSITMSDYVNASGERTYYTTLENVTDYSGYYYNYDYVGTRPGDYEHSDIEITDSNTTFDALDPSSGDSLVVNVYTPAKYLLATKTFNF